MIGGNSNTPQSWLRDSCLFTQIVKLFLHLMLIRMSVVTSFVGQYLILSQGFLIFHDAADSLPWQYKTDYLS